MDKSSPQSIPDAELIQRCLAGKQEAWGILLSRYERLIYHTALCTGMDADEAADVFQTVSVVWLKNLGKLRDPQCLGAWLVTTTRRECWARWKHDRETGEDPETILAEQIYPGESPEVLAAQAEDARFVTWALKQMAEPCRSLLWLLYFDQKHPSYTTIADRLNMAVNSIGATRARCLEKLKILLEQIGW